MKIPILSIIMQTHILQINQPFSTSIRNFFSAISLTAVYILKE